MGRLRSQKGLLSIERMTWQTYFFDFRTVAIYDTAKSMNVRTPWQMPLHRKYDMRRQIILRCRREQHRFEPPNCELDRAIQGQR